ncbi:uncharacterized protein LOC119562577 isoform X1 [Drosophila subpulchrella]|uniref:uncharacterized protein LOC119562577 isoform X1 n=1 Tax=Drosophila subpulchrella TaxID=1486046 RepID=UPI0018A16335|nr:uncharacterized protein LOC119562577 isoform X1 [Drosophila subpulchrella]
MEERPRKRLQEEAIPQQGESAEYFKCWRRSSRESQWEGTFRVGLRSLHGHPAGRVLALHSLAASAELEVALDSMAWRVKGCLLRDIWSHFLQHQRNNPVSKTTPTSSRSNMPIGTGLDCM